MTRALQSTTFTLKPVPPFRLDLTVVALRRRDDNLVDRWDEDTYKRILTLDNKPVEVAVQQIGSIDAPRLQVTATGEQLASRIKAMVTVTLERLLGIRIDLSQFYRLASRDSKLDSLAEKFRGLKPPRFPTVFEALVNGIVCQQLSLTNGIRLLNGLAEAGGVCVDGQNARAFPRPLDLNTLGPSALTKIRLSRQQIRALTELSSVIAAGVFDPEKLPRLTDAAAIARLCQLWGVGRWTAEYTLLRGLGRLRVFPGDDVGARNNLEKWLRPARPFDYEAARRALARWKPFAGLIYFHLLLLSREQKNATMMKQGFRTTTRKGANYHAYTYG